MHDINMYSCFLLERYAQAQTTVNYKRQLCGYCAATVRLLCGNCAATALATLRPFPNRYAMCVLLRTMLKLRAATAWPLRHGCAIIAW